MTSLEAIRQCPGVLDDYQLQVEFEQIQALMRCVFAELDWNMIGTLRREFTSMSSTPIGEFAVYGFLCAFHSLLDQERLEREIADV